MRQKEYKDFSLAFHQKGWRQKRPNVCQFELTFACPLHCKHCYTDCYNKLKFLRKELNTEEIFYILDKVYNSGAFWLCLTGGDPLARKDFLEIYAYAKRKGFIVTIFTSAILITEEFANYFQRLPPFCIELTLNAITQKTYEAISGVKGSFKKAMAAIFRLKKRNIPFKIKTQVTRQNIDELDKIGDFIEGLGLEFRPSSMLHARLNGDLAPCSLRLTPQEVLELNDKRKIDSMDDERERATLQINRPEVNVNIFNCAAGADTIYIDPYGNMVFCLNFRSPAINLLKDEIGEGLRLFCQIKTRRFQTHSKCRLCPIWYICYRCPGRAVLEVGDEEAPIDYFCRLANLVAKRCAKKY